MKILWLTFKDLKNPTSGGAEKVNEGLIKKLSDEGHEVILLVAGFRDCKNEEIIDGYKIIRLGNKWTVYWLAFMYYKKNLKSWADLVIDEVNTIPFFVKFYAKEKNILLVHQLCRQIWFYEMFFPLNIVGYFIEPFYLKILSDKKVITISESTKNDLIKFGFKKENIFIIRNFIDTNPIENLSDVKKYENFTILSLGAVRKMKRTKDIIKSFELAKLKIPHLRLIIAGNDQTNYSKEVLLLANKSPFKNDISFLGKVSLEKKMELMQKSHILAVTSVKEGWGLVVTEANSQGTPAIAYNVDGLRDSIKNSETGLLSIKNNPKSLSEQIVSLLKNKEKYEEIRKNCWKFSLDFDMDKGYKGFLNIIKNI